MNAIVRFGKALKRVPREGEEIAGFVTFNIFASSVYTLMSSRTGPKCASGTTLKLLVIGLPSWSAAAYCEVSAMP